MKIVFIRHGKPDYKTDTLLELGRLQAQEVAKRLIRENISEIYSSTMGRAMETSEPFSEISGLSVEPLEFAREINWGSGTDEAILCGGNPWFIIPEMVKRGRSVITPDGELEEIFEKNAVLNDSVKRVTEGLDLWLAKRGYIREGNYYRVAEGAENKTVAIFCHGGSSTAMISHLLSIPFMHFCAVYRPYFTSVSVIDISAEGDFALPKIKLLSDDRHTPRDGSSADIKR